MSETETREALSAAVRVIDRMKDDAARMNRGMDRLKAERNAARAEVARLRESVEAVLAEGPDTTWTPYDTHDIGEAFLADSVLDFVADLRAALVPVVPPGEAESGEGDVCSMCGHAVLDLPEGGFRHVDSRLDLSHPIKLAPVPVSSGGQADGEPLTVDKLKELLRIAARPVLSREALRERLDEHWPELSEDRDDFESAYIVCQCGWRHDFVRDGRGRMAAWRDHLADVLAGEQ